MIYFQIFTTFRYKSLKNSKIIALTGINIDMCNTSAIYFQIFKPFGYKELKNSEIIIWHSEDR